MGRRANGKSHPSPQKDNIISIFKGHKTTKDMIEALDQKYGPRSDTHTQLLLNKNNNDHMVKMILWVICKPNRTYCKRACQCWSPCVRQNAIDYHIEQTSSIVGTCGNFFDT
jgi:hypothetical protein